MIEFLVIHFLKIKVIFDHIARLLLLGECMMEVNIEGTGQV